MKSLKSSVLFILLFLLTNICSAQLGPGKYKEIAELQKRSLVLALIEPSISITAEQAENYNKALINAVKLQWTTHKTFETKPYSEVLKLYNNKVKNFAVIKYDIIKVDKIINNQVVGSWNVGNIGLSFIETAFDKKPTYLFNLPITGTSPTIVDFQVAIKYFQNFVDFRVAKKSFLTDGKQELVHNAEGFKTKTLLLNKEDINPKLKLNDIKEVYPYNFKIVDYFEIEKAIVEKNPSFLFVYISPLNVWHPNQLFHQVFDTENIAPLGRSFTTFSIETTNYGQSIEKEDLKAYQSFVKEK